MRRPFLHLALPSLLLLVVVVLPLVTGERTLYLRDVLNSHYPIKASQDLLFEDGSFLPSLDPLRGGGQPLLGNPNAVPLYPDNLLYLLAHPLWALNAHFWIHWLLALFSGYALGRAWRLKRPGSWACGVVWATGGYFLSQLNLYNLVATAALAPALVASFLAWERRRSARSAALATLLWGLVILAGDPTTAVCAFLLAVAAVAIRARRRSEPSFPTTAGLVLVVLGGVLLAAPMVVEMLRILPLSFRGHWQYRPEGVLAQSWHPVHLLDWLVPGFFGRVDLSFWGQAFFGGHPPFFLSLFPGWLAVGLAVVGTRTKGARVLWAWVALGSGLFVALGAHNPLLRLLVELPGAALLRYPVKAWLGVALGLSLLAGLGFDRLVAGSGRRTFAWTLGGVAGVCLLAASWLRFAPPLGALRSLAPDRLTGTFLEAEIERWLRTLDVSILVLAAALLVVVLSRRRRSLLALLLVLHGATQLLFLSGLFATDEAAIYRAPSPALAHLPANALVAHGGFDDLFGPQPVDPRSLPDLRHLWQTRMDHAELLPLAGAPRGVRYAFSHSPEGLDSFYTVTFAQLLPRLDDLGRLRILEASGVDVLLLARALSPAAAERARLVAVTPSLGGRRLHVYRLDRTAPEVAWVEEERRAEHLNAAVAHLLDPSFDPRHAVVLPGETEPGNETTGRPGRTSQDARVVVERRDAENWRIRVRAPADGYLVVQRAWLPLWRATVDDEEAQVEVANGHRMAVAVPAGERVVELRVDRRLTYAAALVSLVTLFALARFALRRPQRSREAADQRGV